MNTARRQRFVEAFLDRQSRGFLCATRAAALASSAWPGKQGPRLTTTPTVRAAIDAGFVRLTAEAARRDLL